jgi:hypothetical protein
VTSDMIRGFNRDTAWLATGVLGAIIFAALVLAVQEHQAAKASPPEEAVQARSDRFLSANVITEGRVIAKSFNGKLASGEGSGVDHAFNKTSLQEDPSSQIEPTGTGSHARSAFAPEINRDDPQASSGSGILARQDDSARTRGLKVRMEKNRSSLRFGAADVKRRLIELWHQSLAWGEKSRNWTAFSKLNSGLEKKTAYTAGTND